LRDLSERVLFPDGYLELQADSEDFVELFQKNLEAYNPVVVHNQSYPLGDVYSFHFLQRTYGLPNPAFFVCNSG
jgi:hypothetical protein